MKKLPNGEWNYRTFGTGDGFVADMIIAGILKGGNVEFDLTNGTLLIGNSISDYQLLFDGSRLSIGNFGIDAGVLEFTTEEYYRDYTLADMSFARWMHIKGITPTQEDLLIYDLNNDGVIDGFDIMIIKRHYLGTVLINRVVKSKIEIGTATGKIEITTLYKDGSNWVEGEKTFIDSNKTSSRLVEAKTILSDTISIGKKLLTIDSNGFVKATEDILQ